MIREIQRVQAMRFANVLAVVYGAIFAVFVLIMAPIVFFAPLESDSGQELQRGALLGFLALYPVMGVLMGWIGGLIVAAVYNLVAQRLGGVRVEIAEVAAG